MPRGGTAVRAATGVPAGAARPTPGVHRPGYPGCREAAPEGPGRKTAEPTGCDPTGPVPAREGPRRERRCREERRRGGAGRVPAGATWPAVGPRRCPGARMGRARTGPAARGRVPVQNRHGNGVGPPRRHVLRPRGSERMALSTSSKRRFPPTDSVTPPARPRGPPPLPPGRHSRPRSLRRFAARPTPRQRHTGNGWSSGRKRPSVPTSGDASRMRLRTVRPIAAEVPGVAAVRELAGLSAYRSGPWREAVRHLEAARELDGFSEHLPVLMDCQRALHRHEKVTDLWAELRHSSPGSRRPGRGKDRRRVVPGRSGDLPGAIAMLARLPGAADVLRNPSERHVRQWYVLADLYERAGDVPRARQYFERVGQGRPRGLRRDSTPRPPWARRHGAGRPKPGPPGPARPGPPRRLGPMSTSHEHSPRAPR